MFLYALLALHAHGHNFCHLNLKEQDSAAKLLEGMHHSTS